MARRTPVRPQAEPPSSPRARDKEDLATLVVLALATERTAWQEACAKDPCLRLPPGEDASHGHNADAGDVGAHLEGCTICCARAWRG